MFRDRRSLARHPTLLLDLRVLPRRRSISNYLIGFSLATLLTACADQPTAINCPPLPPYSSLEQGVLADQLPSSGAEVRKVVEDYFNLRAQCTASLRGPVD